MAGWTQQVPIEGPDEAATLIIGVQCSDVPVGGQVRYTVPGGTTPGGEAWEGIDSGWVQIVSPNQILGAQVAWPGGVSTEMTISYEGDDGGTIVALVSILIDGLAAGEAVADAAEATTWPQTLPLTGTDDGGFMNVGVACSNVPVGSQLQFTTAGGGGVDPLDSGKLTVTNPGDSFALSQQWPAKYSTTMTVSYTPAGGSIPPGAALVPYLSIRVKVNPYWQFKVIWSKSLPIGDGP